MPNSSPRYTVHTPNGHYANKKWHVEDTVKDSTVFICEHEGDAQQHADKLNAANALGSLGGKARASKYSKEELSAMGKKGGRPVACSACGDKIKKEDTYVRRGRKALCVMCAAFPKGVTIIS